MGKMLWAGPCSLVGLALAAMVILLGGEAHIVSGVLEASLCDGASRRRSLARRLPFRAITLGHVVIAATRPELERLRAHERIHVEQYEHWGIAFFLAYAASSVWQLLNGRRAYWDNHFEVQARLRSAVTQPAKRD